MWIAGGIPGAALLPPKKPAILSNAGCVFLRLFLRKQEIYAYSHLKSPPFSRTRAMQFSRQLRHRKVTKPLDSLDTSKARHSCERGHVDLIFSHATQRKLGKTYADAV